VNREYQLEAWLRVTLDGEYLGPVMPVAGGYQARPASGEPMYPHLGEGDRDGIVHASADGAAGELVAWARGRVTGFGRHVGTLEVAS
jgi:hypothetical protein